MDIYYNRRVGGGVSEPAGSTGAVSGVLRCAALASADPIRMTYRLRAPSRVHLAVYDVLGRLVETLVNRTESEGEHVASWHARVPNGPYFCCLNAGEITETTKIVVTGRR